jgi:hypothetical protein
MGYFCLADSKGWEDCLSAVVSNIRLLKETSTDSDYSYLFDFMENYLADAKKGYLAKVRGEK